MSFKKRLWWWFIISVALPVLLLVLDSKHPIKSEAELYGTLAVFGSFSVAFFWMIVVKQEDI